MARNGETFRELGKSVVEIQHRFRFGDVSVIVFLFFFFLSFGAVHFAAFHFLFYLITTRECFKIVRVISL